MSVPRGKRASKICVSCYVEKAAEGFPLGRDGKHSKRHCWACTEAEAYTMDGYRAQRSTWTDARGVKMRRCSGCSKVYRLKAYRWANRAEHKRSNMCRRCIKAKGRADYVAASADPERLARRREQERIAHRRRHAKNPVPDREAHKRWEAKMKLDPDWRIKRLEDRRMNYKLKREREGLPIRNGKRFPAAKIKEPIRTLPSSPLVALVEGLTADRGAVANLIGEQAPTIESVCAGLGIHSRTFRQWREGETPTVRLGTAERVLLNADIDFSSVYSYDDHAGIYRVQGLQSSERTVIVDGP